MKKENTGIRLLYKLGGISCLILIAYSLITMLIMISIGGPPETTEECFTMLKENRLYGLLRLDILTVFVMPLYYLLFYGIYLALKDTDKEILSISTIFDLGHQLGERLGYIFHLDKSIGNVAYVYSK